MGDSVISGYGNPLYRYEDLLMRRRVAALSGQHRVAQRCTKQLAIFRAAFDLPQMEDDSIPLMRNHLIARDPKEDSSMAAAVASLRSSAKEVAGMSREAFATAIAAADKRWSDDCEDDGVEDAAFDAAWMRRQTTAGIDYLVRSLGNPRLTRKREGDVTVYEVASQVPVSLTVLNDSWCASVKVGTRDRPLVAYREDAEDAALRGVTAEMASDAWNGRVSPADAQRYSTAWVKLARELSPA